MKLIELKHIFHQELDGTNGKDEVQSFFFLLTENYLDISRVKLALEPNTTITKSEVDTFFKVLERLKNQEPIQYILGETEFYGLQFKVNKNVLIPRPETEELVDWIIKSHVEQSRNIEEEINILDIGTGSGCIAISLAKHLSKANIYALDVSESALKIAKENAEHNNVDIRFIIGNALNLANEIFFLFEKDISQKHNGLFDIIVSNPPYVRELEKQEIKPNVLDNEPHLALFVEDDNPLIFYKAITNFAVDKLKPNGSLYFEINQYLGRETEQLLKDVNFKNVELRKDIFGNDRMLKGTKNQV